MLLRLLAYERRPRRRALRGSQLEGYGLDRLSIVQRDGRDVFVGWPLED